MGNKFLKDGMDKYEAIQVPEELEKNLRNTLRRNSKARSIIKVNKGVAGIAAALIAFVILVNLSSNVAYGLNQVPIVNKLVKLVTLDKGIKNIVSKGKIQQVNVKAEDNGAKVVVNSVAGDNLKLWIDYDLRGDNLMIGEVKFKDSSTDTELPWFSYMPKDGESLIEVSMDKLVKKFNIEFQVYKHDALFDMTSASFYELDEKAQQELKEKFEKNKVATLTVPIMLDEKIFKNDLNTLVLDDKEVKTKIGIKRIEKLELSETRSRVFSSLISEEYDMIKVVNPKLIDESGKEYSYPISYENVAVDNRLVMDLVGGINSINGLTFKCDGIEYVNKKDRYLTIDLKNKKVEDNGLGVKLIEIQGNKITLNSSQKNIQFSLQAENENGENLELKGMHMSHSSGNQELDFMQLKGSKIILKVEKIEGCVTEGFKMKLVE